jgi:hypothetical protein
MHYDMKTLFISSKPCHPADGSSTSESSSQSAYGFVKSSRSPRALFTRAGSAAREDKKRVQRGEVLEYAISKGDASECGGKNGDAEVGGEETATGKVAQTMAQKRDRIGGVEKKVVLDERATSYCIPDCTADSGMSECDSTTL